MLRWILPVAGTALATLAVVVAPSAAAASPGFITGVLTSAQTGHGVPDVSVRTHVQGVVGSGPSATTGPDGSYQLEFDSVTEPTRVQLCFYTRAAYAGPTDPGYLNQCYLDVFWPHPLGAFPDGITTVTARPGHTTVGVDMALAVGGGISGRLVSLSDGAPLPDQGISVIDASGKGYDEVFYTDSAGRYVVRQQPAGDYRLCVVYPGPVGPSPGGYFPACYPSARIGQPAVIPPPAAVAIPVTAGQVSANRTIRLPAAAAITGALTAVAGEALRGLKIEVLSADGTNAGGVFRDSSPGTYLITGLHPHPGGYAVCVTNIRRSKLRYGYAPECVGDTPWLGSGPPPAAATFVPATANVLTEGADIALDPGAALAGQVLDAASGDPVTTSAGLVRAFSPGGVQTAVGSIKRYGRYELDGLSPSSDYVVCFDPDSNLSTPYLAPTCYRRARWTLDAAHLPADAALVPVVAGHSRQGTTITASHGGAIHGSIRQDGGNTFAFDMAVEVFDPTGKLVQKRTITFSEYTMGGLPPSSTGYTVCFDPTPSVYRTDLAPQCYRNVAWNGDPDALPAGTTPVVVTDGVSSTVNVTLHLASRR